jgi:hypothetical protein
MATKYILDPSGDIINPDALSTEGDVKRPYNWPIDTIISNMQPAKYSIHQNVDVDVGDDFGSDDNTSNAKVVNIIDNDSSFGFVKDSDGVEQTGSRESFKPMYHFSDADGRYFAKEFEMLTGYTGILVGDMDEKPTSDIMFYIFEYFIEIIALLGVVEGFTALNEALSANSTNHTNTVEKFDLRLGKYSIVEYDIFSRYIFTVLNYPKDHSNFLTRITSLFVGFAAWLTPDEPLYIETIIEEASRKGSKQIENIYDLTAFKNQFVGFGLLTSVVNIAIATLEIVINTITSDSSYKRLNLLTKKFRQEKAWKNQLYKHKSSGDEAKFFVEMDYYYFRFAIERIQVGLKLLNRYAHEKTYLNPNHREGPLTRVSGHRTTQKVNMGIMPVNLDDVLKEISNASSISESTSVLKRVKKEVDAYLWDANHSDSNNYKPGMTTRLRALPQLLNLSNSFLKSIVLNKGPGDKRLFNLDESILQNFYKHDDNARRIPKELVKELEDYLESEYVPFYMHDLRTNEVLSFHAFIENVSDAFTPEYVSTTGFGRIDDVRSYVKTTRNINLTFTVAATSETDHDFMWYQINKLVTMVYPQWSEGFISKDDEGKPFFFPFTQVPTASPLIRLRLGDVLKNNYSRSSLSRIFGTELDKPKDPNKKDYSDLVKNTPGAFEKIIEEKSFVYELLPGLYKVEPDESVGLEAPYDRAYYEVKNPVAIEEFYNDINLKKPYNTVTLKKTDSGDVKNKKGKLIRLNVDTSRIMQKQMKIGDFKDTNTELNANKSFSKGMMRPFVKNSEGALISNNPITNAYESGMSRGIAGFITQLDVNYSDSNWETSRIGSKAPMLAKITLNFAPVHDIPPGIDYNGMMRAPIYNVGRVNNQMFGDPHDGEHIGSGIENAISKYDKIKKSSENQ